MIQQLVPLLVVWLVAALTIARRAWLRPSSGLAPAYAVHLTLIHWVAATTYLLEWNGQSNPETVLTGFRISLLAIVALAGGCALGPRVFASYRAGRGGSAAMGGRHKSEEQLSPLRYVACGLGCYFVLLPLLRGLPSVVSVASCGLNLALGGVVLGCWRSWRAKDWRRFAAWCTLILSFPVLTVLLQGFLGYGVVAVLSCGAAVASFSRRRRATLFVSVAVFGYLGLSVYVSYMRDRTLIRDSVWGGEDVGSRVDRMWETAYNIELFNPTEEHQLRWIDSRLNQNVLVGAASHYLEAGRVQFANGETLIHSLIALIPRALWPNKPVTGGSRGYVSQFTGIRYADGTSVGMGQVFEFYINFGALGVVVGFVLLGAALSLLDEVCGARLREVNNVRGFVSVYVPGLSLLQAGGAMAEITASVAGSIVLVFVVHRVLLMRESRRRQTRRFG